MNNCGEKIIRYANQFLNVYAPVMLTSSDNTIRNYEAAIASYFDWLEACKGVCSSTLTTANFETSIIEEWMQYLVNDRHIANQSVNVRLSALRAFIKYLSKQDVSYKYLNDESSCVNRLSVKKSKIKGLSRESVAALNKVPDTTKRSGRLYLVMMILTYNLALRLDELLSIKIKDIILDVRKPYIIIHGKGGKTRSLSMLPRTIEHLCKYIEEFHDLSDKEAYLFYTNYKGKYIKMSQTAIRKQFKKYAKEAHQSCINVPLNLHPHMFRHARATHMLEDGMNIAHVSEFLGHEDISTTMVYLDISMTLKEETVKKLESDEEKMMPKKWKDSAVSMKDRIHITR